MKHIILLMTLIMLSLLMPVYGQTGDIHINRNGIYLKTNEENTLNVYMDTTMMDLGAYRIEVRFDPAFFDIPAVAFDAIPGFTLASNTGTAGLLTIAGVSDGMTIPPRQSNLLVLPLVVLTKSREGFAVIQVDVLQIIDADYKPVISQGKPVIQKYSIHHYIPGDINQDRIIDIVDALLIAQYYVGLHHLPPVGAEAYDVNEDNTIDIVDALLVAQYYVGLIDTFTRLPYSIPLPHPGPTSQPGDMLFFPQVMDVTLNRPVPVDLYMNTGFSTLCGYQVTIAYDPNLLSIDQKSVLPGSNGVTWMICADTPGKLVVNGLDVAGMHPDRGGHLLNLTFQSREQAGISPLYVTVDNMFDDWLQPIGTPTGGTGAVRITPATAGDVNHDGTIDLKDALVIQENGGTFLLPEADVKGDQIFTDTDLQILMEYTIGNTDNFYGLGPIPALPPLFPPGTITISPQRLHIKPFSQTTLQLNLVNIDQEPVTFHLDITYDASLVEFVTGFAPDDFLVDINSSTPGTITVQGSGRVRPGLDNVFLTLDFQAGAILGRSPVTVNIKQLQDATGETIGDLATAGAEIVIQDIVLGDANGDSLINMIDAFIVGFCYVGTADFCFENTENFDVNQDGMDDIIDALMIAQYSAGIIDTF